MTSVEDLKGYFESGNFPNSQQFKELITSMWHKSEKLPIEQIEGLVNQFANKFDKGSYNGNAQQLYDELKNSINEKYYNGLNTYPTKTIADGLNPFPVDYTPMKISKDGANNGRYFSLNGVWVPDDNDLNNNIENINDYEGVSGLFVNIFNNYKEQIRNAVNLNTNHLWVNELINESYLTLNSKTKINVSNSQLNTDAVLVDETEHPFNYSGNAVKLDVKIDASNSQVFRLIIPNTDISDLSLMSTA